MTEESHRLSNEEIRKAIEKYQKEHPLHFGAMIDVTAISSIEGADIISQTIEKIRNKIDEDQDLWCICEMAKMYMQGVKPVYPVRPQGKWGKWVISEIQCPNCFAYFETDCYSKEELKKCPICGAQMIGDAE